METEFKDTSNEEYKASPLVPDEGPENSESAEDTPVIKLVPEKERIKQALIDHILKTVRSF